MKRSLVAATAAALLLAGCATGETGHLDPEIEPDLISPRSTPAADSGTQTGGTPEDLAEDVDEETAGTEEGGDGGGSDDGGSDDGAATPAPGTSGAPGNDVEAAFAQAAGAETWFADVTAVDVDGDSVLVTTLLTEAGADAVAVCEAALQAAESTGIAEPSVEVRSGDGETLSGRDAAAGSEGCSG